MLESIRKRKQSMYILLALGAIILVFVFWGAGPMGSSMDPNVVATADGEDILLRDYVNLYKRNLDYLRARTGGADIEKDMDLKYDTVNILINRALAVKEARRRGIRATDEEVQRTIMAMPVFQKDGRFDKDLYFKVLGENRVKAKDFEASIAEDIATEKMREEVVKDVDVTEDDVKEAYLREMRRIDLRFASFDPEAFRGKVKASDDEAKEFLRENSSDFIEPVRIKAGHVYADYEEFSRKVKLTESEIKDYYEKNSQQFTTPEEVRASHILIRTDEAGGPEEARKRAEEILEMLKKGESFEKLAGLYSQDPGSRKSGGDLGFFPRGTMVKPFEEAAFALAKGELSTVVETPFGYHIIKATGRKPEGLRPIKEVEGSIKRTLTRDRAREDAARAIETVRAGFQGKDDVETLRKISGESGLAFTVTPFFSEKDIAAAVPAVEEFRDIAFLLKKGETSRPVKTPGGEYLFKIMEREEAYLPPYEKISAKVKERLLSIRAGEAASARAREFLEKLKGGDAFDALAKKEGVRAESTGLFRRGDGFMPKIGAYVAQNDALFELTGEKPVYPEVLVHEDRFYVLAWKGAQEADLSGLAAVKDGLASRLLAQKQEEALGKWVGELRSKAKIRVFEDRL